MSVKPFGVEIKPSKPSGSIKAPPSKSMAHRALICAGLAKGKSTVRGIGECEDVGATLDCLSSLGAKVSVSEGNAEIIGIDRSKINAKTELFCRESGSTIRFFLPIALLFGKNMIFRGSETLFSRPLSVYEKICREQGFYFSLGKDFLEVRGKLPSGNYRVAGNVSSQFISGLLFALPVTDGYSIIETDGRAQSRPYINMTLAAMSEFGVYAEWAGENRIIIAGGQKYEPRDFTVEGDFSAAAVLDAFNYVGGELKVEGLSEHSLQGDKIYKEYFEKLKNGYAELDFSDCPDIAPICMALASLYFGGCFKGTKRLRFKESDRATSMATELSKFGAVTDVGDDFIIVEKSELHAPNEPLSSHNDHRIAMALTVVAARFGGKICGAEAAAKSFPDFYKQLCGLGADISFTEEKSEAETEL